MFNRRKRSFRKGPPSNQIYVPHDQRKLTADPIPIMTEQQAQYYLTQLKDMGYIPDAVDNYQPMIIMIKKQQANVWISFDMNDDQSIKNPNINSNTCDVYDVYGNQLDKTKYDLVNILDQNGYKLYPILAVSNLTFYNATNTTIGHIKAQGIANSTVTNIDISPSTNYNISTNYSYFQKAYPAKQAGDLVYYGYSYNAQSGVTNIFSGSSNVFYLRCYELTCIVVPT